MSTSYTLFSYQSEPYDAEGAATCRRLEEALRAAGVAFERHTTDHDTERTVPDPNEPGGWTIELGSASTVSLMVAEADAGHARAVLAGLT